MKEEENTMSNIDEMNVTELSSEELEQVAGGKYKRLPAMEGFIVYQIKPHDTLYKLSKIYHTTIEKLMECNPQITDRNLIRAGAYMYIPR